LNWDIVKDLPGVFSSFLVDLRDIKTETKLLMGKSQLIDLFTDLLNNKPGAERQLDHMINPTTKVQYKKGF
jgi:putative protease